MHDAPQLPGATFKENRGSAMNAAKSTRSVTDEPVFKLPTLEAEVMGLRQLLAEVKANRDELRQEMDVKGRRLRFHSCFHKGRHSPSKAYSFPP